MPFNQTRVLKRYVGIAKALAGRALLAAPRQPSCKYERLVQEKNGCTNDHSDQRQPQTDFPSTPA
jgi:hypothetical protein